MEKCSVRVDEVIRGIAQCCTHGNILFVWGTDNVRYHMCPIALQRLVDSQPAPDYSELRRNQAHIVEIGSQNVWVDNPNNPHGLKLVDKSEER